MSADPSPGRRVQVGDRIELDIEAVDEQGLGHGSIPGTERRMLAPDAFPGERVEVRVEALARHSDRAHGRVTRWIRPAPARRVAPCDRHQAHTRAPGDRRPKPKCGGCPLMTLELDAQREAKRAWIERTHGLILDGPILGGAELGYRWSSKRIVAGQPGHLIFGSRASARRGGLIADMHGCPVDHPAICAAIDNLELRANELRIEAWDEATNTGDLRYIWAKTDGERVLVTLITGSEHSRAATELGAWLVDSGSAAGVAHGVQAGSGNAMRGRGVEILAGVDHLRVPNASASTEVGPLGFLQPNPEVAAMAYAALLAELDEIADEGPVLDLYAGAGLTTTRLRQRFREVVPCESYPESAARLGVRAERAEDMLLTWLDDPARKRPTLVVANPPRAGLGAKVCARLVELAAPELRIMSCSAKTLAADLERLAPHYQRTSLRGFDTLPQTGHLELVAWLEYRADPA